MFLGVLEVEDKVLSICSNISGMEARHDSDTIAIIPLPVPEDIVQNPIEISSIEFTEQQYNNEVENNHANIKIPDMDESLVLEIHEEENESLKENKRTKWHPKALKTKVSNVLKADTISKSSVTARLDKLSAARLELVELQMKTTKKQHQFIEDKHKLKMIHLANDEARKQAIHEVNLQKFSGNVNSGSALNDIL